MRADLAAAAFSSDRLRLARFRAGFTVRDLAERAGVTAAAVSQYENGRSRPTPAVLARIAIATGVEVGFFSFGRPALSARPDDTHFRSLRSTTKQRRLQAWAWSELVLNVCEVLEQYVRLPDVAVPLLPVTAESSVDEIEAAANELRKAWGLPAGPAGHLLRYMEANGIVVARLDITNRGVDAFSRSGGSRPVVVLTTDKGDAARARFDAAHELGHLVCHPDADPGGNQEQQAHAFAAELLMPRDQIVRFLPRRFDLGAYARLKQTWGVSISALLYRAHALEVITDAAYRRAVTLMSTRYGRTTEPYPLLHIEQPLLLARACDLAQASGVPYEQIAGEACLPVADLKAIIGDGDGRPSVKL